MEILHNVMFIFWLYTQDLRECCCKSRSTRYDAQWTFKAIGLQHHHHIDCIVYAVHYRLLLNDRMIETQWYRTRWSIGFDDRSSTLPHSSMYLVVVWHSIANHFQDALIRHIIIIISPCRPPSSHNVHQYISCNIGATLRSIDVTEHRCYVRRTLAVAITLFVRLGSMIWVLRCSQYPSTVICSSQFTYWWWGWWQWWW